MLDTGLIGILVLVCSWGVLHELGKPDGVCQFPFWASITFLLFVVPQLVGLRHDTTLPTSGLAKTTIMSVLCLIAIHGGYAFRPLPLSYLCIDMRRWRI